MATCRSLDLPELKELQSLFRPFSQSFVTLHASHNISEKKSIQPEIRGQKHINSYFGYRWVHGGRGVTPNESSAQHSAPFIPHENLRGLLSPDGNPSPLCSATPGRTPSALVGPEHIDAGTAAVPDSLKEVVEATIANGRQAPCTPGDSDSIPASLPPINMVPQTCFDTSCVPESLLDRAAAHASDGVAPDVAPAGCGVSDTPGGGGNAGFHLQYLTMVPETCFDEIEWLHPPQLGAPSSLAQLQRPVENSQALLSAGGNGPDSVGTNIETMSTAAPGPAAAAFSPVIAPEATEAGNLAALDRGGAASATSLVISAQLPEGLTRRLALETAATPLLTQGHAMADFMPNTVPAAGAGVRSRSLCLAPVRPAPPPGYDFDLDADAEHEPAAMQTGTLGPTPGLERTANSISGNSIAGPGLPAIVFDYLLDEPTPPPKQLPKGTRLLKPGQRAPPPPQQSALPQSLPQRPQPQPEHLQGRQQRQQEQLHQPSQPVQPHLQNGGPPSGMPCISLAQHESRPTSPSLLSPKQQQQQQQWLQRHPAQCPGGEVRLPPPKQHPLDQSAWSGFTVDAMQPALESQAGTQQGRGPWLAPGYLEQLQYQPQPQQPTRGSLQAHGGEQVQRPHKSFYSISNIYSHQQPHYNRELENPQRSHLQQHDSTTHWQAMEPQAAHHQAHGCNGDCGPVSWAGNPTHLPHLISTAQLLNTMPQHILPEQNPAVPVGLQRGQLLYAQSSDEAICHRHTHSGISAVGQAPWQPLKPQPQQGAATIQGAWKSSDQLQLQQQPMSPQHQQHQQQRLLSQQFPPPQHQLQQQRPQQQWQQQQDFPGLAPSTAASWSGQGPAGNPSDAVAPPICPHAHQRHLNQDPDHPQLHPQQRQSWQLTVSQVVREPSPPQQHITANQQAPQHGHWQQQELYTAATGPHKGSSLPPPPPPQQQQRFPAQAPRPSWGQMPAPSVAAHCCTAALPLAPREPFAPMSTNTIHRPWPHTSDLSNLAPDLVAVNTRCKQLQQPGFALQFQRHNHHAPHQFSQPSHHQPSTQASPSPQQPQMYGSRAAPRHQQHMAQRKQRTEAQQLRKTHGDLAASRATLRNPASEASAPRDSVGAADGSRPGDESGPGSGCGFRTAANRTILLSDAARQRAAAFWAKVMAEEDAEPDGLAGGAGAAGSEGSWQQQPPPPPPQQHHIGGGQPLCDTLGPQVLLSDMGQEIPPTVPLVYFTDEDNDAVLPSPKGAALIPLLAAVTRSPTRIFEVQGPVAAAIGCRTSSTPAAIASTGGVSEAEGVGVAVSEDHTLNLDVGGGSSLKFSSERLRQASVASRMRGTEVLAEVEAEKPLEGVSTGEDTGASTDAGDGRGHGSSMYPAPTRIVDRPPGAVRCTGDNGIPEAVTQMAVGCPPAGEADQQDRVEGREEAGECAISTVGGGAGQELCVIPNTSPVAGILCGFSTASGKPVVVTETSRMRAASWLAKVMGDGDEEEGKRHCGEGEGADASRVTEHADAPNTRKTACACGAGAVAAVGIQKDPNCSAAGAAATEAAETGLIGSRTAAGKAGLVSEAAGKGAGGRLSKILQEDASVANEAGKRVDCMQEAESAAAGASINIAGMTSEGWVQGPGTSHGIITSARVGDGGAGVTKLGAAAAVPAPDGVVGFRTANGKPVVISEAARRRAMGWMEKVLNEELEKGANEAGSNDGSGGGCRAGNGDSGDGVIQGSIMNGRGAGPSGSITPTLPGKVQPTRFGAPPAGQGDNVPAATTEISVGGFSTAGGRPIIVSEAARQRAAGWLAKVLNDDDEDNSKDCGGNVGGMLGEANGVRSSGPNNLGDEASAMTTSVGGKVAGGGVGEAAGIGPFGVGVSEAVGAAAAISRGSAVGFSTAGGTPVVVSEAARKRAEGWLAKILNDEDEDDGGRSGPALAAAIGAAANASTYTAANAPATLVRLGPASRLPRSDGSTFKPPARRRAASLGPDTAAAHVNTSTPAAPAAAAGAGTCFPPTSLLPDAQLLQPTVMPQGEAAAGVVALSGAFAAPSGLGCRLLPAASIVALPPAAIALPRSGMTFPSGRSAVLSKEASMYVASASGWEPGKESGVPAEAAGAEANVTPVRILLETAIATGATSETGALAVDVAAAAPAGAAAGERTVGGEDSLTLAGGGQQASACAAPAVSAASAAAVVNGDADLSAGDRATVADGAGIGSPHGLEATLRQQAAAEMQATGFITGNGNAILVDSARLAAAAAFLQVVDSDYVAVSPSAACTTRLQTSDGGAATQGAGPDGQPQECLLQQLLEQQQQPSAATSPVVLPVAICPQANTSLRPPGLMAVGGGQIFAVGEEHGGPVGAKTPSAPAAAAGSTVANAVEKAAANTEERTHAVAHLSSAEGMSDMVVAGGGNLDIQAGMVHPPLAPTQPAPAVSPSATAAKPPTSMKSRVKSTDGSELSHMAVTGIPTVIDAASGAEHRTPLRFSAPRPAEAAAAAATASAAATPRTAVARKCSATTTPGSGLRAGPPPSTGGLKRPRTLAGSGSGAGPTHGPGRPPRHGGVATAPAAASVGNKRKFVSPLPAGYKGKPGAADCRTPLSGDAPVAASRAAWGSSESARRRSGQGSPKRPRLSSLFELEARTDSGITKLPLRKYFALPLAPVVGTSPPTSPGPHRVAVVGAEMPIAATEKCSKIAGAGAAFPVGDGGAAVGAMADDDAMAAAVAAAAPSHFAPVTQGLLDGITSATATDFRFWVALEAPSPQPPSQPENHEDVRMATEPVEAAQPADGGRSCAAAATASMVWDWWGAAEARAALQRLVALPRSARERATDPWVTNHYRWIVWKLAAYERRFPAHCRGRSLTPAAVLDQLRRRVQVELVGGGRPILAAIFAHDRPAGLPMVLAISGMPELSGRSHFTEGMHVELTDGWYSISAGLDSHLAQLVLSRRLVLGSKLRVCGAELQSERPGEPLDSTTRSSSVLRLQYNGCSPAAWDARLGAQVQPAAMALRPLGQVVPGGGTVPATLLLVVSNYGILTYENTPQGVVNRTARAQEERLRSSTAQRNEAASAAAASVQRAELDRCRGLLRGGPRAQMVFSSTCSASFATLRVQRAYATMVVRSGGGGDSGGGGEDSGGDQDGAGRTLSAEEQAQLSRLISERQAYLAAEVDRFMEEAINRKPGGASGGSSNGGDCGVPYLRLRVVGVTPHGVPSGPLSHAMLRIWRPPEELDEQLREGQVLLAMNLTPGAYGSGGGGGKDAISGPAAALADLGPNGRLRCLELTAGKMTRFRTLGQAADLSHQLALPGYQPRRQLRLADIAAALPASLQQRLLLPPQLAHAHGQGQLERDVSLFEFDFTGCVVRVGEVQMLSAGGSGGGGRGVQQQWVFLADQTSGLCAAGMPGTPGDGGGGEGNGGTGGAAGLQPWMLAVKMVGTLESVDFLLDPARQAGAVICFRHLILQDRDVANQLWVAAAPDTASVIRVAPPPPQSTAGSTAAAPAPRGGDPLLGWARGIAGREQLALYGAKVDRLLGRS